MNIVGNDISEWQGTVDWTTYKNNANFVILRCSIGTYRVDNQFVKNRDEARAAGLPLGFYHYSYPQYNTPEAEADYFIASIGGVRQGEVLVLDFEEKWADPVAFCKAFLTRVSSKLNGYKPMIYLNQSQLTSYDWKPISDSGYGLWVAAYTYDPTKNDFQKGSWPFAAAQQWTNKQSVPGISGNVDGDVFFGDQTTFKKYGYQPPAPAPETVTILKSEYEGMKKQISDGTAKIAELEGKISRAKADLG